jgi:hypothetical protein
MKGRKTRATGGVNEASEDLGKKNMRYTYQSNVDDEAEERKHGGKTVGKVRGAASKQNAGRMARKSGGSANANPFSSARSGTPPKSHKVEMDS